MILPIALYDWFVVAAFIDLVGFLVVWRFHEGMTGWLVALCVYAGSFAVPSLVRAVQGRCDGGYGEILIESERLMLLAAIPLAVFVELTPVRFALYTLPFGIVGLVLLGIRWYKSEHIRFNSIWEGGRRRDVRGGRRGNCTGFRAPAWCTSRGTRPTASPPGSARATGKRRRRR